MGGFEDLVVWQRARALSAEIARVTASRPFWRDRALQEQMRRAAVSVVSNIAEGFERNSRREFARFLVYAKGSCGEVRAQLYVALDSEKLSQAEFERLKELARQTSAMIGALLAAVRRQSEEE